MLIEKDLNDRLKKVDKNLNIVDYLRECANIKESYNKKEGFQSFEELSINTDDYIAMRRIANIIEYLDKNF